MIRTQHVSLEFKKLSIPDKIVFGKNVYEKMLANAATFGTPDVPVATLLTINTALFDAAEEAKSGDFQKVAAMHEAEKVWDTTFSTEAGYVDRIANGVESIILLAGYKATKAETKPAEQCPAATGLKAVANVNEEGGMHAECDQIPGAVTYIFVVTSPGTPLKFKGNQFNPFENGEVMSVIIDTHRKVNFSGLKSGTPLWLYVIGVNSVGMGVISSPVGFKVL